jgi:non-heme chloroperoxidase
MSHLTLRDGTEMFFKDLGDRNGIPLVFSHGWPLSADEWEPQLFYFTNRGFRCIAHDRRGHGRSSQSWKGHDMDTYADDLLGLV